MPASQKQFVSVGIEVLPLYLKILEVGMHRFLGLYVGSSLLLQHDASDNAVPVGLRIFGVGMTAGIELLRHSATVVNHNG